MNIVFTCTKFQDDDGKVVHSDMRKRKFNVMTKLGKYSNQNMHAISKGWSLIFWVEDIFPNDEGVLVVHKEWSVSLPSYQCIEIIHMYISPM